MQNKLQPYRNTNSTEEIFASLKFARKGKTNSKHLDRLIQQMKSE